MTTATHRPRAAFNTMLPLRSLKTKVTLFMLAFFLAGIWSLAIYSSHLLQKDMENASGEQQFSTVSVIAAGVNQELEDRIKMLEMTAAQITPAMLGNAASMQAFLKSKVSFPLLFNYGGIVLRRDGVAIAEVPNYGRIGINYSDRDYMAEVLKGKATISKPVMGKTSRSPFFSMLTPIRDPKGRVIGVLAGATDLSRPNFLDKITDGRYGKTGGFLVVAPQHHLIITATDKRLIMAKVPDPGTDPLIDRFVQGYEGSGILVNPVGVKVLASAKGVPAAGWYAAAALPVEEAFAPIRGMKKRITLATIFLTLLAGTLTWWMLKRQLAPIFATIKTLATLADADQPPQPLPITRKDEIGELIGGFNRLLETLRQREGALKRSEQETAVLAEIGRVIGSTLDINEVYERFAAEARKLITFDRLVVNLNQPQAGTLSCAYVYGMEIPGRRLGQTFSLAGSVNEVIIRTREGVMVQSTSLTEIADRYPSLVPTFQAGMLSMLSVPLIARGEVIGGLHFRAAKPDSYTVETLRLAERIGTQIAGAIANAEMFNNLSKTEKSLRESEQRYQALFEQAGDGIFLMDTNGNLLSVNRSSADMHGFTVEEMLRMGLGGLAVEGSALVPDRIRRIMRGETLSFESEHYHKDGHTFPVAVTINLVSSGSQRLIIAIHRDLTERKRAEDEMAVLAEIGRVVGSTLDIRTVYEQFASITRKLIPFDTLTVHRIDAPRNLFRVSFYSGLDIPGRSAGQELPLAGSMAECVIRSRKAMVFTASSADEMRRLHPEVTLNQTAIQAGFHSNMLIPLFSNNEIIGILHFRAKKENAYSEADLRLAEKIATQIAGAIANAQLFNDVTKMEDALRENKMQFDLALRSAAMGVWQWNIVEDKRYFDDQACNLLGVDPATFTGAAEEFFGAVHREDRESLKAAAARTIELDVLYEPEYRTVWQDGSVHHIASRGRLVRDDMGRALRINGIIWDITDRRREEEEKRSLEERLQRAEKMEALGTLAGGVAHDLNNVLGIVVGYAEMLLDEIEVSNPQRDDVMKIMEGGHRSASIVQDLLTLARRGVQTRKVVNLNDTIEDCRKTPEFEKILSFNPKVRIKMELEPDILNIMGSPVHIGKTIINLVSNAVEAMPYGGTLTIATSNRSLDKPVHGYDAVNAGDYVVFSVVDTGEGISEGDIKHIFEPFYTKKVMGKSGTGLGLAVVWGTVKDQNGYIDVQSEVGKGTIFTLYFPVTRDTIDKAQTAVPLSDYIGNDESILVVDDIKEQRELAAKMLGKLNYRVTTVSSGEEAVAYLRTNKVDMVILDMIMDPGMDGLDTYRAILELHPKQKAIIVSGFSQSERVQETQKLGAGPYIKKPYVLERLGMAVRNELDKK